MVSEICIRLYIVVYIVYVYCYLFIYNTKYKVQ